MDELLRTPLIWITVLFIFPAVHPWAMRLIFRQVQLKWFAISNVTMVGSLYLASIVYQDLLLSYSTPKNSGGIATVHLAYEWAAVAGLVGWLENHKETNAIEMTAVSVIGSAILLAGFWVA